jgi:hypothetical protein
MLFCDFFLAILLNESQQLRAIMVLRGFVNSHVVQPIWLVVVHRQEASSYVERFHRMEDLKII